jgi:hypothetical protein
VLERIDVVARSGEELPVRTKVEVRVVDPKGKRATGLIGAQVEQLVGGHGMEP